MNTVFTLIRNQVPIGKVHWQNEVKGAFTVENSGKINGDESAVNTLNHLVEQARLQGWKDIFPHTPNLNELSAPLTYPNEFLSMLIHGGYDIPPELQQMYDNLCGNWDTGGIDVDF